MDNTEHALRRTHRHELIAAIVFPILQILASVMIILTIVAGQTPDVSPMLQRFAVLGAGISCAAAFASYVWLDVLDATLMLSGQKRLLITRHWWSFLFVFLASVVAIVLESNNAASSFTIALLGIAGMIGVFYALLGVCWLGLVLISSKVLFIVRDWKNEKQYEEQYAHLYQQTLQARGVHFASLYIPIASILVALTMVLVVLFSIFHGAFLAISYLVCLSLTVIAAIITHLRANNQPFLKSDNQSTVQMWIILILAFVTAVFLTIVQV